jgi:cell division ATPase FtsA
MEYVTGHSVRIGHPTEKLAKGLVEEVRHPMYATATGLVAYALEQPDSAEPVEAATQKRTRGAFRLGGGTGRAGEGSILGGFKKFFEKAIDGSPVE